jgi:hypothetical protein
MHAYRRSSERSNSRSVVLRRRSSSSKFQMCSLSLSLVFFLLGVFSFANLVAKHHGALLIVTVTATSAAYLLGGGGALICDFFLL